MNLDREYFESLYRQHYTAIMRFAARRTDEQSARDVTADTFLAAWRRLDTLPRSNELAWLYTAARNILRTNCAAGSAGLASTSACNHNRCTPTVMSRIAS